MIPCSLALTVNDVDQDHLRVRIVAGDGAFAGTVDLFEATDVATDLATRLSGFPNSPQDVRAFELGTFVPGHAGGGLRCRLSCIDLAGHARAEVELTDRPLTGEPPRMAHFTFPVHASSLDSFLAELRHWGPQVGDTAILAGAT